MKTITLPNGMTIRDVSRRGALAVYDEIFERECYRKCGIEIKDGNVILDVGANVGLFALWLSTFLRRGYVHAFEPVSETYHALLHNLDANGMLVRHGALRFRVMPWSVALGGATQLREFHTCPRLSQVASAYPWGPEKEAANRAYIVQQMNRWPWRAVSWMVPGFVKSWLAARILRWYARQESETCQVWDFAAVVRNLALTRVDLLKIDAEGSEFEILHAISDEHWRMIRQVVVEVHNAECLEPIAVMLENRGFHVIAQHFPPPSLPIIYARHSDYFKRVRVLPGGTYGYRPRASGNIPKPPQGGSVVSKVSHGL